jgi:4-carboxymuconolactone decarboxylase
MNLPGSAWRAIVQRESLEEFALAFAEDPVLVASVANAPVRGAPSIRAFFAATAAMYESIAFTAETSVGQTTFLEWSGHALGGLAIEGFTVIAHDSAGLIERVELYHRPLSIVVAFARELERRLGNNADPAMRLPLLLPADLTAEQQALYQDMRSGITSSFTAFKIIREDGALMGPWNPYLHEPTIGKPAWDLTRAIDKIAILPRNVREIAVLVVAARYHCAYQIYAHVSVAKGLGIPPEQLASICAMLKPAALAADEGLAYDVAHALCDGSGLPETLYRLALSRFGQRGTNELIFLVGLYSMVATTLNAFDVPVPV